MRTLDRGSTLLLLGSTLGLLVAVAGLVASGRDAGDALGADAVARVNGIPIRHDDYVRALQAVATDRRAEPDGALRRHVLDRLIDEELLVQRGLELGLPQVDTRVRRDLATAVIDTATAGSGTDEPAPGELAAFYEAERGFFARGGRLHVRQVFVAADRSDSAGRAADAAARLRRGDDLAQVRADLGDAEPVALPDGPLPVAKLAEYLGPTPLRASLALAPGAVADPVRSASGFHVLLLVDRGDGQAPALDEIRDEVRAEWRRRSAERALRAQLAELRARATVEVTAEP